nr:uncharacterized protein LOC113803812 [Penaeus vannamei]
MAKAAPLGLRCGVGLQRSGHELPEFGYQLDQHPGHSRWFWPPWVRWGLGDGILHWPEPRTRPEVQRQRAVLLQRPEESGGLGGSRFREILDETAKVDTKHCGRKLLCVASSPEWKGSSPLLQALLRPFSGEGPSNGTVYGDYDEAVWRGSTSQDCAHYTLCEYDPEVLLGVYGGIMRGLTT